MDLLLQAAKVLESENLTIVSDRSAGRSTRGFYFHGSPKGESESRALSSPSSSLLDDNADTAEEVSGIAGDWRRAGGAGTREVHNQLEKNRRKQMRECFNQLQQCVPSLENKRVATHSILQGAIKHIKNLKKKDVEQEREIQMHAKRKSDLKRKYDVEFNKCSGEQQQKAAEVRMVIAEKRAAYDDYGDDEGHASDSTSTASEGPGNEDNFSDEEKGASREKPYISRVNPIVAAKLDGFRKRKLATLDLYPKSTDYIIASMNDAGYLSASSSKQKPTALSSVSSSSAALKNMLEQKKRQQSAFIPSIGSQSMPEHLRPKMAGAPIKFTPSNKGISSLTSSHPMISNQLAAINNIPLTISTASVLANAADATDQISQAAIFAGSNFSPLKNRLPTVLSLSSLPNKTYVVNSDRNPQPMPFNPTSANSILSSAVLPRSTMVQEVSHPQLLSRTGSRSLHSDAVDNTFRKYASTKSPPVLARPVNVFLENSIPACKSTSSSLMSTIANHISSSPVVPTSHSVSQASNKIIPTVFPLSLIQGLALNHNMVPMSITSGVAPPNSGINSTAGVPFMSAVSPILQPKIHPSEILLASPMKIGSTSPDADQSAKRITTLLAATTHANTLSGTNISSSVSSNSIATMALPEVLKTVSLTPTMLPFAVTAGHLPTSTTLPHGANLRFFAPNSVVNGQASLMPTVVQLDGSGQVTLLQNFVQLQTSQMLGQPIVVVTTPNSIMAPVTSAAPGHVNYSRTSSSSASLL